MCPVCGRWLGRRIPCAVCSGAEMGFSRGIYGFYYERGLREAVHAFKFRGRKDVGRRLARLAGEKVRPLRGAFDRIVPVPASAGGFARRGFNQSTSSPRKYRPSRVEPSTTGRSSSAAVPGTSSPCPGGSARAQRERRLHVRDRSSVEGKRVLFVDDLFTTYYTASGGRSDPQGGAGSTDVACPRQGHRDEEGCCRALRVGCARGPQRVIVTYNLPAVLSHLLTRSTGMSAGSKGRRDLAFSDGTVALTLGNTRFKDPFRVRSGPWRHACGSRGDDPRPPDDQGFRRCRRQGRNDRARFLHHHRPLRSRTVP